MGKTTDLMQVITDMLNYKRNYKNAKELETYMSNWINRHHLMASMDTCRQLINDGSDIFAYQIVVNNSKNKSLLTNVRMAVLNMEQMESMGQITGGIAIYLSPNIKEWNNSVISFERSNVTGRYYTDHWNGYYNSKYRFAIFKTSGADAHL